MAYYSGKIEEPKNGEQPGAFEAGSSLIVLPANKSLEVRSDSIFLTTLFLIIGLVLVLAVFKIRIFGKTLAEYLKPIWYFVLISITVVFWQYLFGVNREGGSLAVRVSQWIWEACVALSAYQLVKKSNFGYRQLLGLGVLYSFIIHGLKVSVRYFFYAKTLWYALDRFLYGSLLVLAVVLAVGSLSLWWRQRKVKGEEKEE